MGLRHMCVGGLRRAVGGLGNLAEPTSHHSQYTLARPGGRKVPTSILYTN